MSYKPELIDHLYDRLSESVAAPVFIYSMPANEPEGVLLRENMPGASIDQETGDRTTGFQVVARGAQYHKARELARNASLAIRGIKGRSGDYIVRVMLQRNEPYPFPLSAGDSVEFVVNFSCQYGILE